MLSVRQCKPGHPPWMSWKTSCSYLAVTTAEASLPSFNPAASQLRAYQTAPILLNGYEQRFMIWLQLGYKWELVEWMHRSSLSLQHQPTTSDKASMTLSATWLHS